MNDSLPEVVLAKFPDGKVFWVNSSQLFSEASGFSLRKIRSELIGAILVGKKLNMWRVTGVTLRKVERSWGKTFWDIILKRTFFAIEFNELEASKERVKEFQESIENNGIDGVEYDELCATLGVQCASLSFLLKHMVKPDPSDCLDTL